jgi:hypothetical protein
MHATAVDCSLACPCLQRDQLQQMQHLGVPPNLLGAAATVATAGVGWYLDRRLRAEVSPAA